MTRIPDREYQLSSSLMSKDKEVNRLKIEISDFLSKERSYLNQIDCLERKIKELELVIDSKLVARKTKKSPLLAWKQ